MESARDSIRYWCNFAQNKRKKVFIFGNDGDFETDKYIQSDKLRIPACLVNGEDSYLAHAYKCYLRYRSFEGSSDEIKYPEDLLEQLNPRRFNSNSWAQSFLFWS